MNILAAGKQKNINAFKLWIITKLKIEEKHNLA
jgi:hypothetical protein